MSPNDLAVLEALRLEARARGVRSTALALGMARTSLTHVLNGTARLGTVLLAVQRARRARLGGGGAVKP